MVRTMASGPRKHAMVLSQSPQGGAMVRTTKLISQSLTTMSLNPLKAGQWFGQNHQLVIPNNAQLSQSPQGGAMVRTVLDGIEVSEQESLNPLKAGQWFGLIVVGNGGGVFYCLNPLKAGQWFGQK